MSAEFETSNAVIKSARFDLERGCLSAWLYLDFGSSGQGFGGFLLYAPSGWAAHDGPNYTGHFIWRCLEIAGVDDWAKLKGRTIRAKHNPSQVLAIGHIVKDNWFDPAAEFAALRVARDSK